MRWGVAGWSLLVWLAGCTAGGPYRPPDSAEVVLAAPKAHVQETLIQVLTEAGYPVKTVGANTQDGIIRTGYREETDSVWDWLLVHRFGVGRSYVDVALTPEGLSSTRLVVQVTHEAKDGLFDSWKVSTPPLPQSPANYIRLIKNALGLL